MLTRSKEQAARTIKRTEREPVDYWKCVLGLAIILALSLIGPAPDAQKNSEADATPGVAVTISRTLTLEAAQGAAHRR
jgi:hypothetical protein